MVAGAAEIDGWIDGLGFEWIIKLDPLDSAGRFKLVVVAVVVGWAATGRSADAYR